MRAGLVDDAHAAPADDDHGWAIDDVLDAALTTTGAEVAEIFLRDDAWGVSLAGFRGPFAEAFKQITHFEEGQGYPGLVIRDCAPLRVLDASHDARFLRTGVKALGFQTFLCVPIPGRNGAIGSLDVASRDPSVPVLAHSVTLARAAERLALILDRDSGEAAGARRTEIPLVDLVPGAALRLDLRVLGSFAARRGGAPLGIDAFLRRRAVTLLKILITNYGKIVVRDELVELLWPADVPKDASKLLKIAVHYLRRGLGEAENAKSDASFIVTDPGGYGFNPASPHRLDALEFESAAADGLRLERQGRWREAIVALKAAAELYGGDYMEDDPYSDWCQRRRRQLRETLFDVLVTTARLLRSAGDSEAAIRCYRRILELDPSLEDVHRDLMDTLCRSGKRIQALRQFEECRRALLEEFDAAPAMETEALYRSILSGG